MSQLSASQTPTAPAAQRSATNRGFLPRLLIFLSIALSILGGMHYYVAQRLVLDTHLPGILPTVGSVGFAAAAVGLLAAAIVVRNLPRSTARFVAVPTFLWLGSIFLTVMMLAASDLLLVTLDVSRLLVVSSEADWLAIARYRALAVLALLVVLVVAGMFSALGPVRVRAVDVTLPRWPRALDGFRIVQLSDLHLGPVLGRDFARRVVEQTNELGADLIVITGDLVDGSVANDGPEAAPLGELRAEHGCYFVTGNHDHFSNADEWVAELSRLGIRALRNDLTVIGAGEACFELAGVEDRQGRMVAGGSGEDLPRALRDHQADRPVILLAHQPLIFREAARQGVALQLSGHTHGGQIAPFQLLTRLVYSRYVAGLYREGESQIYVSSGTGFWGPPIRLLAPAEITLLTLRGCEPIPGPS